MRGPAGIFNCTETVYVCRSFKYGMNQFVFSGGHIEELFQKLVCVCVHVGVLAFIISLSLCLPAAALGNENTFSVASSVKTCLNERLSTSERQWGFSKERIRKCINRMLFSLKRKKNPPL